MAVCERDASIWSIIVTVSVGMVIILFMVSVLGLELGLECPYGKNAVRQLMSSPLPVLYTQLKAKTGPLYAGLS